MNSIKGGHFVWISGVYKQHPAPRLETECQTGAPSITEQEEVEFRYSPDRYDTSSNIQTTMSYSAY